MQPTVFKPKVVVPEVKLPPKPTVIGGGPAKIIRETDPEFSELAASLPIDPDLRKKAIEDKLREFRVRSAAYSEKVTTISSQTNFQVMTACFDFINRISLECVEDDSFWRKAKDIDVIISEIVSNNSGLTSLVSNEIVNSKDILVVLSNVSTHNNLLINELKTYVKFVKDYGTNQFMMIVASSMQLKTVIESLITSVEQYVEKLEMLIDVKFPRLMMDITSVKVSDRNIKKSVVKQAINQFLN